RPGGVVVGGVAEGRPVVVVGVNDAARGSGVSAGDLVGVAARALGGGGGGRADVAQGGGKDPGALDEALRAVERTLAERVGTGG
ncbi:MAG: DHHA1 domain-containing protein, partial [Actinomycetes bacterium]